MLKFQEVRVTLITEKAFSELTLQVLSLTVATAMILVSKPKVPLLENGD